MTDVKTVALTKQTIKKLREGETVQIASYNADYVELVPEDYE